MESLAILDIRHGNVDTVLLFVSTPLPFFFNMFVGAGTKSDTNAKSSKGGFEF
jgi:hypothetical protein